MLQWLKYFESLDNKLFIKEAYYYPPARFVLLPTVKQSGQVRLD